MDSDARQKFYFTQHYKSKPKFSVLEIQLVTQSEKYLQICVCLWMSMKYSFPPKLYLSSEPYFIVYLIGHCALHSGKEVLPLKWHNRRLTALFNRNVFLKICSSEALIRVTTFDIQPKLVIRVTKSKTQRAR